VPGEQEISVDNGRAPSSNGAAVRRSAANAGSAMLTDEAEHRLITSPAERSIAASVSVCLSVSPVVYFRNHTSRRVSLKDDGPTGQTTGQRGSETSYWSSTEGTHLASAAPLALASNPESS